MIDFAFGMILGSVIGFIFAVLCNAAKKGDEQGQS
jgi:gas vesicle protein